MDGVPRDKFRRTPTEERVFTKTFYLPVLGKVFFLIENSFRQGNIPTQFYKEVKKWQRLN